MKPGLIAPTLIVLLSSGCQVLSYHEPTEGELATLTFSSNKTAAQPVICVPGKGFEPTYLSVSANTSDSQFVSDMNTALNKAATVSVKVDASRGSAKAGFVVQQKQSVGPTRRCRVATQFAVMAGHEYTVHLTEADDHCGLSVTEQDAPVEDAFLTPWDCE